MSRRTFAGTSRTWWQDPFWTDVVPLAKEPTLRAELICRRESCGDPLGAVYDSSAGVILRWRTWAPRSRHGAVERGRYLGDEPDLTDEEVVRRWEADHPGVPRVLPPDRYREVFDYHVVGLTVQEPTRVVCRHGRGHGNATFAGEQLAALAQEGRFLNRVLTVVISPGRFEVRRPRSHG